MKKIAQVFILLMVLSFGASKTYAQIVVKVRPQRVIVNRTPAPSPRHVWIEEEWIPQGNTYVWHGGYWATPPRAGVIYKQGHWKSSRRGYVWVPGHWK